jgi:hypothetical protein
VTAASIIALCASRGLRLAPAGDGVRVDGPAAVRAELREMIRQHKAEVLALLHSQRQVEVSTAYSQAFGRLAALYPDSLIGNLWPAIVAQHPDLARGIDVAEQAADAAALAYQQGTAADSSQFLPCLQEWKSRWAEAIETVTSGTGACSDCGRPDATVMVEADSGRYCRRCLRPAPLNPKGAHA